MVEKMRSFGRKKISLMQALVVIGLFVFALGTIAAVGSGSEDRLVNTLFAKGIKPIKSSGTPTNWLTIGETGKGDRSGVSVVGNYDLSGATAYQPHSNVASLAGVTGTLGWGSNAIGNSGWFLTEDLLRKYRDFMVENSFPYSTLSGATVYSDKCPSGSANTGNTIYLCNLTPELHGKDWTFTNELGTTPYVIYDPNGRFRNAAATGATPFSSLTNLQSGATTVPDSVGESITITARYWPIAVSGWYVKYKNIEW